MTTTHPSSQQLALLAAIEPAPAGGPAPVPTGRRRAVGPSAAQLTLVPARGLPPQLRLDHRTRTIGRAGIAELRRILAEGGTATSAAA